MEREGFTTKYIKIGSLKASQIAQGCMRLNKSESEAEKHINSVLESGINFFDHADIYGGGACEELFGSVLKNNPGLREKIIIQSKCGIRKGMYDFSKEHIISSVEGSLKRLNTDYLDILLLHRPDALCEPQEVSEAVSYLFDRGMIHHIGVSNHNPYQTELLQKYMKQKIEINQLQFGIKHSGMVDAGINVNMENNGGIDRDGGILDYCRLHDITIQPWSPFQFGFFSGVFIGNPDFAELNKKLTELAEIYDASLEAIAIAWILRHPANMQPIVGSVNTERCIKICKAAEIELTRQQWYEIYLAAGNKLP